MRGDGIGMAERLTDLDLVILDLSMPGMAASRAYPNSAAVRNSGDPTVVVGGSEGRSQGVCIGRVRLSPDVRKPASIAGAIVCRIDIWPISIG